MINNRQNGRRRGRGGPQVRNGAGNGADRGNRIDNRARGNAVQLHEKYRNLARDMQTQGDRVMTEYYLQFADHYFRVLSESRQRFEEQNQQRRPRDDVDYDDGEQDGDEGYEGERVTRAEQQSYRGDAREQRGYRNEPRDEQDRNEPRPLREQRPQEVHSQEGRAEPPQSRPQPGEPSAGTRLDAQPSAVVEEGSQPRRGRRPRRVETAPADGLPERIEVDRLPPAFGADITAPVADAPAGEEPDEPAPPRRRRRSKSDDSPVAA